MLVSSCFCVEYICYDDGCHLQKFARSPNRKNLAPAAEKLASVEIVIDNMHMARHVNNWCLENCDTNLFQDLNEVNKN